MKIKQQNVESPIMGSSGGVFDPILGRIGDTRHRKSGKYLGRIAEHRCQHYLLLEAVDGRQHYVTFDGGNRVADLPENSILCVSPAVGEGLEPEVEILSPVPLNRLVEVEAVTWLDRMHAAETTITCRERAFGSEVLDAMERRRLWLIEHRWADNIRENLIYREDAFAELRRREVARLGSAIAAERGTDYPPLSPHDRFTGVVARKLSSEGGQYMLVERARQFSLVPWSAQLEASIGRTISGVVGEDGIGFAPLRSPGLEAPGLDRATS